MSEYPVTKRYGGEVLDIREFVRPDTYMVRELIRTMPGATVATMWSWVLRNVTYPEGSLEHEDYHEEHRYLTARGEALLSNDTVEYWNLPSETLRDRVGDCEDRSILLASMLRYLLPPEQVWVSVGSYQGFGHVWVTIVRNGVNLVIETTLPSLPQGGLAPVESAPYTPVLRFNDISLVRVGEGHIPENIRDKRKSVYLRRDYGVE